MEMLLVQKHNWDRQHFYVIILFLLSSVSEPRKLVLWGKDRLVTLTNTTSAMFSAPREQEDPTARFRRKKKAFTLEIHVCFVCLFTWNKRTKTLTNSAMTCCYCTRSGLQTLRVVPLLRQFEFLEQKNTWSSVSVGETVQYLLWFEDCFQIGA